MRESEIKQLDNLLVKSQRLIAQAVFDIQAASAQLDHAKRHLPKYREFSN
ncbi:MAG: hypothetical protein ACO2Y5_06870 [Nitrosopumilaceae archaeon]